MSFTREEKLAITAVVLAALIGLGVMLYYMGIIEFSGGGMTGAATGTNLPPEYTASSAKFVTKQNVPVQLSLGDLFKDPEGMPLTFVATNTEGLVVGLNEDKLTITPEPGFTGERVVTVFASDGSQVARKQLKIEVTGYNVAKKPEPAPEPEPLPPAPEPAAPQPTPETTPPAPETVPSPANTTNASNETLPAQTEQPAAELPIIPPATEQIAVQQRNIPKVEHEVEERLNNESEITAIVYFNESAVNEAGLIVAQDSKDQRENWLANKRAKVKAARELLLANITSKGFTTSELGFEVIRQYETINAIAVKLTKSGLAKLNQSPNVLNVYSEKILHTMLNQSVPMINAEDLWNLTYNNTKLDGRGVSVCIVDTGIDFNHTAFVNKNAKIFGGYDYVNMDDSPQDDAGHGTHCAGIVGGNTTGIMGVSPNIGIVPVKVCDSGGSCGGVAIAAGIDYCINNSAVYNIATISGSIGSGTTYYSANCPTDTDAAFLIALAAGVTPVFAAGNWGLRPGVSWPSCSPYAISVGNVNKTDVISVSSNYGGDRFDVWAPGSNIYSAALGGGVVAMSGTSMATPHMAAVIAMIQQNQRLQNKPILSITQIHELLNTTGPVISDWRRIDVYAAILKLNANLTMNQSDNSITNVTANTTLKFKNTTDFNGFIQCGAISHNYVSIDSSLCPNLNKSAHITFGNLSFVNATPTRNGQRCRTPICQNATYANGTLEFDVTEFSSYSSTEGNVNMDLIKLDSQDPVNASSYLNYTILINVTQGNASNITLIELYPEQLIYLSAQPLPVPPTNNTFVIGNFTENQSVLVNISMFVLNVSNGTLINNTANVSFQNDTSIWINASVSESTIILNQPLWNFTNISVIKTDSTDPVNSSDYLNYTINLTLTGNGSAYNVTVNDTYPVQVIYQSSQPAPLAGTNNTWNWTSISNGASILINITVFTKNVSNGTILNNTVNVTCVNDTAGVMNFFSYAETNISSVFNITNVSMLKVHSPHPINASSAFNYTINFTNTGTAMIYNLAINDTYPTPLTYISAQPSPDPGTNNYWTLGTFVPNAAIIINVSMSVPNLPNGVMLNNTANATYQTDIGDIIPLTAQDNTPVNNPPNSCPVTINTTTTLNSNLNSGTSCITIGGNNLVLDCAGYQVTYNTDGGNSDYGIGADRKSNITLQNCAIIDNIGTGSYISGINFTKVNSSTIRNTVINSTGSSYTFGISLRDRDQNVTVTNVTIKTRGSSTYNFGVQMYNSTGNIIANSTILANSTSGSYVYGVLIDDYSQNNIIDNSTITADGTSNYNTGVYLISTVSNNIVSGNTIKALSSATLAYSVYLNSNSYQMSQNKVINNNLTVNCSSTCYGVYVLYSSTNGIIENNTINSAGRDNGNTNYGIFLWSSGGGGPGNYTIKNNTIRTYGKGDLNHGIHIWGNWNADNNSVINNNIFPSGTGRANIGVYLIGARSTQVIGNNISTYGTQENHGIDVSSGSAGCLIANNTIVTNGSAGYNYGLLAVTGGDNSTFADNNVTVRGTDSIGIYSDTSQGNSFLNNKINTSGSDGLMILGDNIVYFSTNSIATTNTINGTPIYYYGGAGSSPACPNNQVFNSPNTNHIDFIGCNNVTLSNYAGSEGILLANTTNSTINYTVIRDTRYPVRLFFNSSYNNITYSNLTSNHSSGGYGVWIAYSAGNNLVSASDITTIGLATDNNYGVYIAYNSSNNTITGSSISTNGSRYNYGVYATLNANDNTVSNNLIRTKGSSNDNKGAYLYSYASGNSIINNTIITNGTNYDDGIHVYSYSNNNRLENNTINADGIDFVYGINVQTNSQNNTVKGNNITIYTPTTNIQTANGIYLQELATKTTVDKNSILMYTYAQFNIDKNHGIYLINAHNNTITNNRVDTKGIYDYHLGIYLSTYSSNNLIENNTVITGGRNYNYGIVTNGMYSYSPCNNNTIKNNTILVNGTAGINYGIYEYQYNNKNDILGNRITTNCTYSCEGIRFYTSGSNAMIANNTIIASGSPGATSNYGIYMYSGSNNNVMADNNITTTGPFSHGIQLIGSTNETLHNNNITIPALAMGLYIDTDATTPDISQFLHTIDTQNTINGTPIYYYGGLGDSPTCPNNQVLNSPNSNHIDFIGCNNATLNGFTAFEPVTIVNATNGTVNNSMISNAYVGVRLFFNSAYNTISNCNITSENTSGTNYGILVHHGASRNTIKNNNISATSTTTGNYGIYLFNSSKENNITNNFIFVNGTSNNYGIYLQRMSSKNLFENNNIRVKASSNINYGVYIYQSAEGNTIRNCTINTNYSTGSQGVLMDTYASNNTVTGCTIRDWASYGIYFTANSHNNTASYNDMRVNNANIGSEYGIYLNGPFSGTQIIGNNITNNCSQNCYGLNVYNTVQNGIIANNTIRTIGGNANNHGIYLNFENTNNNISGNRINAMGRGIWVQTASQPNRFNDNNITAIGDYAVYLQSATGSLFNGTFFDNSTYWINSDASSRNNFTNTAFGTSSARITILPLIQLNTTTIQWNQINASFNKTYINSTALPFFNTSGLVTLNGLTGSVATALVDYNDDGVYEDCPSDVCVQQSFSGGTFVFNVTHFTGYSANTSEGPLVITSCPVTINSSYTLTQNLVSNDSCITMNNSNITFDCAGFNISYNANGGNGEFGIVSSMRTNVTIKNCNIIDINETGTYGIGINFSNTSRSLILNNTIITNGTQFSAGISIVATLQDWSRNAHEIAGNTIRTSGGTDNPGILLNWSRYGNITNNTIIANGAGSHGIINYQGNDNYINNTITSYQGDGIYSTASSDTLTGNFITAHQGYGIYIDVGGSSSAENNTINDSAEWIYASLSGEAVFTLTRTRFMQPNGSIIIDGPVSLMGTDNNISKAEINISQNKAFANSSALGGALNTSGEITLNGLAFTNPKPIVDYEDDGSYIDCPPDQCIELGAYTPGGPYVFNTTHFTVYSAAEEGTAITGCPVTINESTTLTQDLITSANKSCITMNSSNITLDCAGHTILYATNGTNFTHGVFAYKQNNLTVKDCVIMSVNSSLSYSAGINFTNVTNILIQNNTIVTNGTRDNHGFFVRYSSNVTVINNTVTAGTTHENYGIIAANTDWGLIANNIVRSCCGNTAVGIFGQTNFTITNNAINVTGASSSSGITVGNENIVENNTMEVHALNANSGITTSDRVTVRNNTIYINGTSDNIGVNANNGDLVVMNNITVIGTSYCYALSGDSGNVFENNTARLFASGHDNAGVYDNNNNVIKNNSIIMNGTYANEGMRTRDNSTIIGNRLTMFSVTYDNVIIYAYSDTTLQYNNFILNGSADTNVGLDISYVDNFPPVIGNNVSVSGTNTITGIYLGGQTNVTVIGNNVTVTATDVTNYGIDFDGGVASAAIENNLIRASGGDQTYGIIVRGSVTDTNNITANNISVGGTGTDGAGIALMTTGTVTGQRVINNNINITASGGSGIFLGNATTNTLTGNNVTSQNGYAVFIAGGGANSFANTSLIDPRNWLFVGSGSSGNTFIRTLFAQPDGSILLLPSVMPDNTDATKAKLYISANKAFLNSSDLSALNTSGEITLNGIALAVPRPMVDYKDDGSYVACPADQCTNLSYLGNVFVFNTTHFTGYAAGNAPISNSSNITITKTDNPDPVNVSTSLTYQINVSVRGNGTAYNVTVNDTYPPQVIYITSQPTPVAGTNNSWVLGNLTQGTNISINITVFVLNISNNTLINNTANATFQNETSTLLSVFATENTTVIVPAAPVIFNFTNISVIKTDSPDPVNVSSYLNYTINVTISGNGTAYNVTVNETYPPQVIYQSSQPAPVTGTNNTWILGNLTAANITINITVLVQNISNNTLINNTANTTCTNETGALLRAFDTENTTVLAPPVPITYNFSNMTIRKMDNPDPVNASSNLTYQINVSSTGNGTAYNVTVNDTYPPQAIYLTSRPTPRAGTNNSWLLGNLTAGTNVSVNVTLLVLNITNGTTINNTANVTFQNETGALFVYGAFAETTVLNPPVFNVSNITVAKTGVPNPVAPGGQLNYTITVTSSGNGTAYNVTVNETYPPQVIYLTSQPTPAAGTNNSWLLGNLTAGSVVLLNITVNVPSSVTNGTVINNTVNLTFQNETGTLLGRNADTSTNVSNVTPTPPTPTPSSSGGGSGGGAPGGVRRNTTAPVQQPQGCVENWECDDWTACTDNSQSRSCIEANGCANPQFAPQAQRSCQPQKPAQEERPAELPSEIQHSGLPEQQPLEFPEEKSGISISSIKTSISDIAKPVINLFKAYLWPIIFIIIALLLLTAGYAVFTHRRPEEIEQMPGQIQMPEETPEPMPAPKLPPVLAEPRMPEARPEPRLPAILPRMPKSEKKFYTGIDAKLADINKKLASLDKTNKKLEKKLKKK
jgi:parallel beta-helix repeat protein